MAPVDAGGGMGSGGGWAAPVPRAEVTGIGTAASARLARLWFPAVVLSAAVYALGFPPWEIREAVWCALVPFFLAVRSLCPRRAALAGLLWGTAAIWMVAYWVPPALLFYYQQPWWFGLIFCVTGSLVLWGSQYMVFAAVAAAASARTRGLSRVGLLSLLWVACEFGRARLVVGEPWMLLGYALIPYPSLIQGADVGGVYLLSFVAAAVNAALAEALSVAFEARQRPRARAGSALVRIAPLVAFGLGLPLLLHAYGSFRLRTPLPAEPAVPVLVVQGNNDLGWQWQPEFYGRGLDQYLRLTATAAAGARPEVIVWPESAVTFFLAHEPRFRALVTRMLDQIGADLIVGGPHYEDEDPARPEYFNSAFYVDRTGKITSRYDKRRLLPFAEYFPLRTIGFLRRKFERVRTFTPGEGTMLLDTRMGKAAVVICFEAVFPELVRERMRRGADVLVNLSNDVWLGDGAGAAQHLAMARLRAVENRTWLLRATTTGVSAIVDPWGRIRAESGTFVADTLRAEVVPMRIATVYKSFGDLFAWTCLAAGVLWTALLLRARLKR